MCCTLLQNPECSFTYFIFMLLYAVGCFKNLSINLLLMMCSNTNREQASLEFEFCEDLSNVAGPLQESGWQQSTTAALQANLGPTPIW